MDKTQIALLVVLLMVGGSASALLYYRLYGREEIKRKAYAGDFRGARSELYSTFSLIVLWPYLGFLIIMGFVIILPVLYLADRLDDILGERINNLFGKVVDGLIHKITHDEVKDSGK